ncbi:MAG: carboxypeptidase-like regulatory domain-containing protein [Bryobacteraceae bacterium]
MFRITWITASLLACSAEVKVSVIDPSGKAIQAATVAADCADGKKRSTQTDAAGHAQFPNLPTGNCRIAIQQPGFESWTKTLPVEEGKDARLDAALQLARRQESVAVKESLGKRFKNWLTSCTHR